MFALLDEGCNRTMHARGPLKQTEFLEDFWRGLIVNLSDEKLDELLAVIMEHNATRQAATEVIAGVAKAESEGQEGADEGEPGIQE